MALFNAKALRRQDGKRAPSFLSLTFILFRMGRRLSWATACRWPDSLTPFARVPLLIGHLQATPSQIFLKALGDDFDNAGIVVGDPDVAVFVEADGIAGVVDREH